MLRLDQPLPSHNGKYQIKLWCLLLLLLVCAPTSHAGIFSTLSKIGKTINNADIDIPLSKLELPDNIKDLTATNIKMDVNNEWSIIHPDGSGIHIDKLLDQNPEKVALVIQKSNLPKNIHQLNNLPLNLPIIIQGKQGRLFTYHQGEPATIAYKNLQLRVTTMDELKDALWLLQRPPVSRTPRFLQIDETASKPLASNIPNSSLSVETISPDSLIQSMHSFKYQTLVLSGKVIDGKLFGKSHNFQGVSLQKLQQEAENKDINLIILESDKPSLVLEKMSKAIKKANNKHIPPYDTTGDFFNFLRDPSNSNPVILQSSQSGARQVAIQWKTTRNIQADSKAELSNKILSGIPLHLLLQSVKIHFPDKQRSQELNDRIIPGIPSWIQFYAIFSVILGFITPATSWRLWKNIWSLQQKNEYQYLLVFLLLWLLHRFLFLILFLPILGGFSFVWFLMLSTYQVFNFILFRPSRWIYQSLS